MVHGIPVSYTGESVCSVIHRLDEQRPDAPVTILHATVPPVSSLLFRQRAGVLNAILHQARAQLNTGDSEVVEDVATCSATVTDHWLLSVPESLRCDEAAVVNYLGMMVAIDFCHWAEVPGITSGCAPANLGEEVTGFAGFYAVVEPSEKESTSGAGVATASASVSEVFAEPSGSAPNEQSTLPEGSLASVPLLRGSAAMMYLLRRAVEVHHIPWFDYHYLHHFHGNIEAAMSALRVCFIGCEKDGVTPLWMPCTRERVELLLSLADAFIAGQTSYYTLLRECGGFIFAPDGASTAKVRSGFVPALVHFHPRYCDFADVPVDGPHGTDEDSPTMTLATCAVPILKLSQLTALAIEQALPALWRYQVAFKTSTRSLGVISKFCPLEDSWLTERAARLMHPDARAFRAGTRPSFSGVFSDRKKLSICCDYQIPKALRAAGLVVYDNHLADVVDRHVLISSGSAEEVSIRVAALLAADRLLRYMNTSLNGPSSPRTGAGATAAEVSESSSPPPVHGPCDMRHLDYALWYVGRSMLPSEARHHLCRTIMY